VSTAAALGIQASLPFARRDRHHTAPATLLARQVSFGYDFGTMPIVKQLLSGRDFAIVNPAAGQMANFTYLIGDADAKEGVLVDPAWDVRSLKTIAEEAGLKLVGIVATHAHPDHVGGSLLGFGIEGVGKLVEVAAVKVWVHEADAAELRRVTGVREQDLVTVKDGDVLKLGDTEIRFIHTPGHSPGSMCLRVGDGIITGDTLFVGACGRIDLPGSDSAAMWQSLNRTLAALPDDLVVYPGHDYGRARRSTIGDEKRTNPYMRISTLADWRAIQGG
jgi:glyoxylase-like metal-dependent hydrolase (beta-lactamase superfamily II)